MLSEMETNKKILIETLIRGKNSAELLQNLIRRQVSVDGSVSVEDLVMIIKGSFSGSLSVLKSCSSGELCGVQASAQVGLGLDCSVDGPPEVYAGNTGKKPAPAGKERRGCYKRRKTIDSRTEVSGTIEDGHAWRKYGQKEILNSKFPRCYFRCTHKHAHGCKALKQVQKLEDGSNRHHITYFGRHTCPTPNVFSHSGIVLDFKDSKNHHYLPSTPSVKHEVDSKAQSDDFSDNISSANDAQSMMPNISSDIWTDDVKSMGFDHEDSSASTSAHGYLDNDLFKYDGFLDWFNGQI